ncbi:SIMPL domain-containing protein [Hymenobacter edaphi]|uniref:DUF541 domain-containing protein n=1 Tax=Hymenobacter edaphi TaxID=2211146 RepID=A0A328BBH2_9BACT|nr:SIMPL domain-containing protein [Hymenobacter edaphi]RAK63801.1 hypothetical protein DLM85_19825 [Hymenobacter edaphi]
MRRLAPAFVLSALAACTTVQPLPQSAVPVSRTITVSGYGEVVTYPDLAEITVDVSFAKPKLKEATAETQAVVEQVITASLPFVRSKQDVRASFVSTSKEYAYEKDRQVLKGFSATQSLTIKLTNLNQLEAYIETLLETRINGIRNLSYAHSKGDSLQLEAQTIALRNALATADKMCRTVGAKRGQVLQISEQSTNSSGSMDSPWGEGQSVNMGLYGKGMGGRSFKLTPELMHFRGGVQATIEIQ